MDDWKEIDDSKEYMRKLRDRSGSVDSSDPLVSFLYILMRDHLPIGEIESIMKDHVYKKSKDCQFTNGWLAEYAKDMAKRLK
jgi:hypothetical protein